MANTYNSQTEDGICRVLDTVAQQCGVEFDFSKSKSMRVTLESQDGRSLSVRATPLGQGDSFRTTIVPSSDIAAPSGGAADFDGAEGTDTLVAGAVDVTVDAPVEGGEAVPADAVIYAIATSTAGKAKSLHAVRLDDETIRIASDGVAYSGPREVDTARGTAVAGTVDVTMPTTVNAADIYFVEQITAGGGAADHFSAFRKDADEVTVQSHNAAGALVATNTSVVRVHKFAAGTHAANREEATLAAGVGNVTLANVAGDRLVCREVTAGGTAANHFVAFRTSDTNVRIHAVAADGSLQTANTSVVEVYNLGAADAANAVLVAGTLDVPLAVAAGDRLSVAEVATGGVAANHYSAFRKNATEVTIQAHQASGALQAGSTSTVRVYNHGQSSNETSAIAWFVRRP